MSLLTAGAGCWIVDVGIQAIGLFLFGCVVYSIIETSLSQVVDAAPDKHFDRAGVALHYVGGLPRGEAAPKTQVEGFSTIVTEHTERATQTLAEFAPDRGLFRRRCVGDQCQLCVDGGEWAVGVIQRRLWMGILLAMMVRARVPGDAEEPRGEGVALAVAVQRVQDSHEDLPREVFRVGAIVRARIAVAEDAVHVAMVEGVEGVDVAFGGFDEVGVVEFGVWAAKMTAFHRLGHEYSGLSLTALHVALGTSAQGALHTILRLRGKGNREFGNIKRNA